MHFRTTRILLLCASVLIGVLIDARPLKEETQRDNMETHHQEKRHLEYNNNFVGPHHEEEEDNGAFPTDVSTEPPTSPRCTEEVIQTFNTTRYEFDANGRFSMKIVEVERTVTQCCEGYDPENDCTKNETKTDTKNDTRYSFDPADPCAGLVCEEDSGAQLECMIVTKCGIDLPLFFDVEKRSLAHCNNYPDTNGQPVDLEVVMCTGFCEPNLCRDLTCPGNPDAVCFVTGCGCKPTWLLPTGVEVDCSTGRTVPPKRRRRETEQNTVCS